MAGNGIIRQHAEIAVEIRAPRPPAPLLRPAAPLPPAEEVEYPDSDGSFLLQNLKHSAQLLYASQAIEQHFRDARAAVAVDAPLYWEQGNNRAVLAPDLMVTLDHELQGETTYQTWIEGRLPDFVLEVVSPSSADNDKKLKKEVYERLGIPEYFLYDPDASQPAQRLLGYRLDERSGQYGAPLRPGRDGALQTPALGVSLRAQGSRLIISNTATGEDYQPSPEVRRRLDEERLQRKEAQTERDAQTARAEREARQRREAQAERDAQTARAEREARQRREAQALAAREARQRREAQAERDAEKARAAEAQAEIRRLKELLRARERPPSSNRHPPP